MFKNHNFFKEKITILIILNEIMKINIEINDNLKDTNWFIREKYNNIINLINYIFNVLIKTTKE